MNKKILLAEPSYKADFKPLGLMRISTFHKNKGDNVEFIKGERKPNYTPDKIYITTLFTYRKRETLRCVRYYRKKFPKTDIIVGGIMASLHPEMFKKEGVRVHVGLLKGVENCPPDYDLFPEMDYSFTFASRGCVNKCLEGNTPISTIYGKIPIKELVGKKNIPLFTLDPKTNRLFITDGIKCQKTGEKQEIIRINFKDDTFIDCTPNHRFLVFKNGNQFNKVKRFEVEAKDLKPNMSVNALKYYKTEIGYKIIKWGRNCQYLLSRMVAEYKIKRSLTKDEIAHHINKDIGDNSLDNIEVLTKDEHNKVHSKDRSILMKKNNASKDMTKEFRIKLGRMQKGRKRSDESKLRYRESKLGTKNPNYKNGKNCGTTRIKNINHKVHSIEKISKADVYNLEVPETSWFFANDVLVHNCKFCVVRPMEGYQYSRPNWIKDVNLKFPKLYFFDNNWLAKPKKDLFKDIELLHKLKKKGVREIDFNQSIDVRLMNEDVAKKMKGLNVNPMRFSFDHMGQDKHCQKAIELSKKYGFTKIHVDVLYNWNDTIEDFYYRLKELCRLGCSAILMRYAPIDETNRDFVGRHWTKTERDGVNRLNPYPYGQVSSKSQEEFELFFGKDAKEFKRLLNFKDIKKLTNLKFQKFNKDKIWKK